MRPMRRCPWFSPRLPSTSHAQQNQLSLSYFDASGPETLYSAADSRRGAHGAFIEGGAGLDDDTSIVRVMVPKSDGSLLWLNDNGGSLMKDYFCQSGDGAGLAAWL